MNIVIRKFVIALCLLLVTYNILNSLKYLVASVNSVVYVENISLIKDDGVYINEELLLDSSSIQEEKDGTGILANHKSILRNSKAAHEKSASFLSEKENRQGKVNVYYYVDVCHDYDNYALLWNNLFPKFPNHSRIFDKFADQKLIGYGGDSRRFVAFLTPDDGNYYFFQLSCVMGCEMILVSSKDFKKDELMNKCLLRFGVYKKDIVTSIQTFKKSEKDVIVKESKSIFLQGGRAYLIDVTHVSPHFGFVQLKWKKFGEQEFEEIQGEYISSLYADKSVDVILPNIKHMMEDTEKTKMLKNNPRNSFHKSSIVSSSSLKQCEYIPDYMNPDSNWLAQIKIDKQYPYDQLINHHHHNSGQYDLFLTKETAVTLARMYIGTIYSSYKLNRIVHIEENQETRQGKRYFVEIDVTKDGDQQLYRSSEWIFVNNTSNEMCKPKGFHWNREENIYLITPVKNQARWVRYLIESLNVVVERTSEKNLHLVLVDFNSEDCKIEDLLKKCKFPHTLLKQEGAFSKVIGLNKGVNSIQENDALVFVFDLQLQIPDFLFDYVRKHTFKKKTACVPILCRLYCGQHPQYTNLTDFSIWQEIGYGMISLFKSDWMAIGGMDEKKFGTQWGGEDWDFAERVVSNHIEIIHHRIPGYYHIYHSTTGTWDGTKDH